ncbi:MAG: 2-methylaconitate cis-trans isomerase PrpF family protein [Candidatus Hodarchaeota archaeon]
MVEEQKKIRCTICRGGTSKGVFIMKNELPTDPTLRDKVIQAIFGSPDIRQIDGLGGADVLTSKLAIIGPPTRTDADVDYTFGQVSITSNMVDYRGNCGNISSGVGPFAIDEGLVEAKGPVTNVRIHQVNTGRIIVAEVSVFEGKAAVEGNYRIDGVPGTGAKISLDFSDFAGSTTGKLLPTGNVIDTLNVEGLGELEVSIVDATNPLIFCRAQDIQLKGTETPKEIDSNPSLLQLIENIRGTAAELIGMVKDKKRASVESPYIPFIAFVSSPTSYKSFTTEQIVEAKEMDLLSRLLFMQVAHKTYPGTGAVCTGISAKIPGTIVNEVFSEAAKKESIVRIGHPAGIMQVEAEVEQKGSEFVIKRAAIGRTARRIMEGYVHVRRSVYRQ